jgi:anti-anti-sigma regulatory factor
MLRMTRTQSGPATIIFVEGKILGPWVDEVRSAVAAVPDGQARRLDLTGVTFVDAAGAELLAALRRDGVEIASCSHFVADLLERYARNPPR